MTNGLHITPVRYKIVSRVNILIKNPSTPTVCIGYQVTNNQRPYSAESIIITPSLTNKVSGIILSLNSQSNAMGL